MDQRSDEAMKRIFQQVVSIWKAAAEWFETYFAQGQEEDIPAYHVHIQYAPVVGQDEQNQIPPVADIPLMQAQAQVEQDGEVQVPIINKGKQQRRQFIRHRTLPT